MSSQSDESFDDILEKIGTNGPFQKRFNLFFNFLFGMSLAWTCVNHILVMNIPEDHWCHVPDKPEHYSMEQWRQLTIPIENNTQEKLFSKCKMYERPQTEYSNANNNVVNCIYGWDYNDSALKSSIPASEDWVCDKAIYVTYAFTAERFGEFIGLILLGSLGDILGRRPVFFMAVIGLSTFRSAMAFTPGNYLLFVIIFGMSTLISNSGFQSPLTIAMEMSSNEHRATINTYQHYGWTLGLCLLPLLLVIMERWDYFLILTSLPGLLFLIIQSWFIESPRWLLSRGRINECYRQLKKIAKGNRRELPDDTIEKLQNINIQHSKTEYRITSLASSWRLLKNVILLCISWSTLNVSFHIIMFNLSNMGGNGLITFFLTSVISFPSIWAGKLLADKLGRRLSASLAFFLSFIMYTSLSIILCYTTNPIWLVSVIVASIFVRALGTVSINLQAVELFPTPIRQTGNSFCLFISITVTTISPYVSYLATIDKSYPFIILAVLTFVACITSTFLPETKGYNLPETLEESRTFGADQSYWNWKTPEKANQSDYVKTMTNEHCL